jgi:hypothetical protein
MTTRFARAAALMLALAGSAALAPQAHATTFIPLSTENLADVATLIVEGEVLEVYTEIADDNNVWTRARVRVDDVWKGADVPSEIVVSSIGGTYGTRTMVVDGAAVFSEGEPLVAFLHRDHEGRLVPIGKFHGKFTIRRATGDTEPHVRRWHAQRGERFDHRFLPHLPPERRIYLSDMEEQVRTHLAKPWDGHEIPGVSPELLERVNTPAARTVR